MEIKLYNTLTKKIEAFEPVKKSQVSMYNCGPTVYDRIHIGNFRTYVFADLLRRMFEYNGLNVKQIINITDIGHLVSDGDSGEDKMTKALKRENKPLTMEAMNELASFYFEQFKSDLQELNTETPDKFPRASEHIQEDINLVIELEQKGYTYKTSDGLYFDTAKFPAYGKLGKIDIDGQKEGARVATNTEKKNPGDFALWKSDPKLGWESPWGKGFPGWHIECSAMSKKYLGQPFDIHTGGIDLVPVHHNNEIAQSEAAHDKALANYWMHNEFLTVDSGKMSKSSGNFITLETLKNEAISPLAYRYWLLTAHYRSPIKFSFDAVRSAQNALIRMMSLISSCLDEGKVIAEYDKKFTEFINTDLDTPKALALAWEMLKDSKYSDADKKATLLSFDKVFGLKLESVPKAEKIDIPEEIVALAEAREEARKSKNWTKADALRVEIENRGFAIKDTEKGMKIVPKD